MEDKTFELLEKLYIEMQEMKGNMATMEGNMATMEGNMATKDDIANMATKDDIANMATKDDLVGLVSKEDIVDMVRKADLEPIKDDIGALKEGQDRLESLFLDLESKNANRHLELFDLINELRQDLTNVEIITSSNWNEIAKLKKIK